MRDLLDTFARGYKRLGKSGKIALACYAVTLVCLAGLDATALIIISKLIGNVNGGLKNVDFEKEKVKILLVVSLFLMRSAAATVASWAGSRILAKQEVEIGQQNFRLIQNSSWSYRSNLNYSDYSVAVDRGPFSLVQGFVLPCATLVAETCTALTILCVVMVFQPITAISASIYFVFVSLVQHFLLSVKTQNAGIDILEDGKKAQNLLDDANKLSKLLAVMPAISLDESLLEARIKVALARAKSDFLRALPRYFMEAVLAFGFVVVSLTAYITTGSKGVVPAIALFAAAGARLLPIVNRVQGIVLQLYTEQPMAKEALLVTPHIVNVLSGPQVAPVEPAGLTGNILIRLSNVYYRYPNEKDYQLKNISIDFLRGKSYAIVGPSGSGKTTFADILVGLIEPELGFVQRGKALLNVGYVPQDTYLIDHTLRNNIALDWRNKSINEDKFRYAIQIAQLDAINARMSPDNSGSLERLDLSGGEKQRVGIARAVYRTPDLLLLDEATSSLDADTEHAITEAIGQIQKDCTVVTIAHRLSSIKNADLVIYLDQGIIVATGTYEELILQVPDFARQVKISDSSAGS